ncbi:hypothetical protein GCM10017635_09370 [Paracoccus kondratievae]|uniref:Arc family DNA-binding protein n=1 Tax=Paracoccus kondratievae TaxID=135740 RepID=A0AAD3RT19_9RHOB|nr:Arc-family transcriptional repressor [Paracoccus phage vB_PkoS_Pkon1]GLK63467.1 hypothetical protein GCM10017635_09370 [Paracoccus kondratievae]
MNAEVRMTVRLPKWAVDFLDKVGEENFTSRNAEIVRSVKERMEAAGGASPNSTPAAGSEAAAR